MWTDPTVVNNLILAIIAIANLLTAALSLRNHKAIKDVKNDVAIVEKATNSMKDDLVKAAGEAGLIKGFADGQKAEQEANKKE